MTAISLCLGSLSAEAVVVYQAKGAVVARSGYGILTPVAGTLTVTIESNLDSPRDVRQAVDLSKRLLKDVPAENVVMVELANGDASITPESSAIVDEFREQIPKARRNLVSLSKDGVRRFTSLASRAGYRAASAARATLTDPLRLSVTLTRFVSATGAAYVGVSLASGLPMNAQTYFNTLSLTAWTGLMSAGMSIFSDAYSEFIIKPGFFSRKIDDSKTLRSVVNRFKSAFKRNANEPTDANAPKKSALGIDIGLYTDQFLKSLSLEFAFVYGSTLASAGVAKANESLSHIMTGVLNGGLGQMFFDQSIAILAEARKAKVIAQYPEGPEREARLKKVARKRDIAMAVNSLAQVWMVMISTRGNALATTALHLYVGAGAVVRALTIPVERKLNRTVKETTPAVESPKTQSSERPPLRVMRCEAIFG